MIQIKYLYLKEQRLRKSSLSLSQLGKKCNSAIILNTVLLLIVVLNIIIISSITYVI